jgi:ATP-dependent helicase/nuclease subunit A
MAENTPLKKLNPEQEKAAYWEDNAVVAAGAGSGKTSVLASRYLWLVTEKAYAVEEILTLTFTRKAAAEMYQRIHAALAAEALAAGDTGRTRRERARAALDDFFHARIQTLDSYSAYIVKQAATRYGIPPDFTVDEDRCRQLAEEEALPFLISRRNHPALERLYRTKKPADIGRDLFAAAAFKYSHIDEPPSYMGETLKRFEKIRAEWEERRPGILSLLEELSALAEAGGGEDKFLALILPLTEKFRANPALFPGPEELGDYFSVLAEKPGGDCVNLAETHPLRERLIRCLDLLDKICRTSMSSGKRDSRVKEICRELRAGFREFSSLLVFCVQGGIILSLMALLDEFQRFYLDKKRAEGILSFTDIARLARTILRDHPDIRYNEKTAFKAIMIDEFQDNNSLQKELLFLLAEKTGRMEREIPPATEILPGKLFFVGDEKQSIYRFRGADVSVFRHLKNELAAEDLALRINYRSSPDLIAAFNDLFREGGVFLSGEKPPYEADYSPLSAHRKDPGSIGVYILDRDSKAGGGEGEDEEGEEQGESFEDDENEAVFAVEKIRDLLAKTGEGGNPRYRPEDIAILFRTRAPQRVFEKHLRLLGIPYAGEGLCGFFADGPVNDLAALLRLISYPLDTEAYAVSLRSPFAGLSLAGLAICLSEFNASRENGGTPVPFSDTTPLLEEPDRRAYEQGRDLYRRAREKAAVLSIGELVSELWYREGYRYETEWNPQTGAYRELFDYLYGQAIKADRENLSLAAFTDRLTALREKEEQLQDTELPLERPGAVRLLTIHKSKGLEFPVVFIAGCGRRARTNTNDEEIYASGDGGLSFNPPLPPECSRMKDLGRNFFYEKDRLEEKRKAAAELRRLLYVAMTRAEDRLIITGTYSLDMGGGAEDPLSSLNRAIKEKREARAKKNQKAGIGRLPGDASLDDGTLFGLLLPALADRWSGADKLPPPFLSLEPIPRYTREDIRRREEGGPYPNNRQGLSRFLAAVAPSYQKAEKIATPAPARDHLSPTSFHTALPETGKREAGDPAFNGEGGEEPFIRVDRILARFAAPDGAAGGERFGPAEFGTLAHLSVEALLKGEEPVIPPRLAGLLSPGEGEILLSAGKELAERFLRSPLGKAAAESSFRRSEYPFRSFYPRLRPPAGRGLEQNPANNDIYISGTIDLLFDREDQVWVVDFKTDSVENPPEHLSQMAFYYRAARDLRKKRCRIWLYYFRTGHAVELSGPAEALDLF